MYEGHCAGGRERGLTVPQPGGARQGTPHVNSHICSQTLNKLQEAHSHTAAQATFRFQNLLQAQAPAYSIWAPVIIRVTEFE